MKKYIFTLFIMCFLLKLDAQVNPVSPAEGFTTFIEGNATLIDNETESNLAIGGDLILPSTGNYRIAINTPGNVTFSGDSRPTGLLINGKVVYNGGSGVTINQNAWVKIGDCTGSNIYDTDGNGNPQNTVITNSGSSATPRILLQTNQPASRVCANNLVDFTAAFTTMRNYSVGLAACTENVQFSDQNGNALADPDNPQSVAKINIISNTTNVLNTTPDALDNIQNLTFQNLNANSRIIINVDGGGNDFTWTIPAFAGQNPSLIFWNFVNIPHLTFTGGNTIEGTVYAPDANVYKKNSGNIQGSVIAKTFYHEKGEIHEYPWEEDLTLCVSQPEICNNGIDDDNDGLIDCDDTECQVDTPTSINN